VRHAVAAAVHLPALLAGLGIERQQVRLIEVVAEQVQQPVAKRRGTAVAPRRAEGAEFLAEMAAPQVSAGHVERDQLAVAEPGVDPLPVGCRSRGREVVLLVHLWQVSCGGKAIFPSTRASRAIEGLDDEDHRPGRGVAGPERGLPSRQCLVVARQLRVGAAIDPRRSAGLRRGNHQVAPDYRRRRA
jgi:hypothetical protein